jgi:hypothetical protein
MKTYSNPSSDLLATIERMASAYHDELVQVTVGALFVFDDEDGVPCLKHQGYPAAAVVRITPVRDRALGIPDAIITVDRATWQTLTAPQKDALIDHELEHLELVLDEETGNPKYDALERPKLRMRKHDHQLGWFAEVARRHGEASCEVRQARQLIEATGQLYFDFATWAEEPATTQAEHRAEAH